MPKTKEEVAAAKTLAEALAPFNKRSYTAMVKNDALTFVRIEKDGTSVVVFSKKLKNIA